MGWRIDWEVIDGPREGRPGDPSQRIWQGETVRFTIRVDDDDPHRLMTLAEEARNWANGPLLSITDSTTVAVRPRSGDPLVIEYRFRYPGHKRLHFSGRAVDRVPEHRRAIHAPEVTEDGLPRLNSTMLSTYALERGPLFPALNVLLEFDVIPEPSSGEAAASTAGAGSPTARRRERAVREGRREAAADRATAERADEADQAVRRERLRSGVGRDGILPRGVSPDSVQDSWEEGEFLEYARNLRAAIAVTPALDLNGRAYAHDGNPCRGYWTWRWVGDEVQFYFHATQVQRLDLVGRPLLPANSDLQNAIRVRTARSYHRDTWVVGRSSLLGSHKVLFRAGELASQMTGAVIDGFLELFEIYDEIMTAFDIAVFVASGGLGSILVMLRRAARALLRAGRAGTRRLMRRAATAVTRGTGVVARGLATHEDDALAIERRLERGASPSILDPGDAAVMSSPASATARGTPATVVAPATTPERGVSSAARAVPDDIDESVERAFAAMLSGPTAGLPPSALSRVYSPTAVVRRTYEAARMQFDAVRDRFARVLGLEIGAGGQVHHAIELGVITRYGPDVIDVHELNALNNMRGIPPERSVSGVMTTLTGRRQLHNSRIRELWDSSYLRIDSEILRRGLVPGTREYRVEVRRMLYQARDAIDAELGMFFSEGRRRFEWRPGMLPEDAASLGAATPAPIAPDPPPRLTPYVRTRR